MKNLISGVLLLCGIVIVNAQVAIEKASVDGDGLLDFASNTKKGIILPSVTSTPGVVEGTLVFDGNDKKIKYYNGSWVELSEETGTARTQTNTVSESVTSGQGVIIGAETSSAPGVLVLESSDKALILPKVASPHLNVVNPSPGMICYDTENQTLSVFNGSVWEFWE